MKTIIFLSCIFFFGCTQLSIPKINNTVNTDEKAMEEKIQTNISDAQKAKEEYEILKRKRKLEQTSA
ncbi:MAG: hypothetical protein PHR75_07900 [Sulfurovum sp.]|nr:hypothetical protein [Sulfurovum sp.]MDD3602707.1 hypothetical protein [Sulfurovum sp.]